MNLYDKDDGFRSFTLKEANSILGNIIETTERAINELKIVKNSFEEKKFEGERFTRNDFEKETAVILQQWSQEMVKFGVYPKGYFTVDFKTTIPDILYCWTFGEKKIIHTHKIYESFKDRVPISNEDIVGFEGSLN